ncbi:MAG: copper transport protein [Acidimicrobiaceae bacterium]|nr:copper transport protein [Acidimicrobiaceae bacterium]
MRRLLPRPRLLAAVVVAFAVAPAWLAAADAHALVRETRPSADQTVTQPPTRVFMRFNEPVEIAFGAIRVYDTDGHRVDRGKARHVAGGDTVAVDLKPGLDQGTYTVTWRVVSADSHPIHEAFVFHVGQPGDRPEGIASQLLKGESGAGRGPSVLAGILRFVAFASLLLLAGVVAFVGLVWRDAPSRVWRLAALGLAAAVVGTVGTFVLQGALAGGLPLGDALTGRVLADVAGTRYGTFAFVRLGALALFAVLAFVAMRVHRRPTPLSTPVLALLSVPLLVALATPGLASHAGTTSPVAANMVADVAHMAAAAAWLGGLVVLWRVAFPALADDRAELAQVVDRFSVVAMMSVAVLVVSGVFRSYIEVRSLHALDAPYGVVLLAKLAAFLPLVAFGFVNQRTLRPRLDAKKHTAKLAAQSLRRNVAIEVAVAVVVLALTAMLVNLAPARTQGRGGTVLKTVAIGKDRLDVLITPGKVGQNEIHLTAFSQAGGPLPVQAMQVLFTMPDQKIGPITADARPLAPGHYVLEGRQLSVAGRWVLEIVVQTSRFEERRVRVAVHVN